jgi:hypothetical protein
LGVWIGENDQELCLSQIEKASNPMSCHYFFVGDFFGNQSRAIYGKNDGFKM